jgi:hypothetical protein
MEKLHLLVESTDINNRNTVCLDRIIDRYSYVKLETNEKCLLGEIDKILFLDIKTSICKKGSIPRTV